MTQRLNRVLFALPAVLAVACVAGCGGDDAGPMVGDSGMLDGSKMGDSTTTDAPSTDGSPHGEGSIAEGSTPEGSTAEGGGTGEGGSVGDGGTVDGGHTDAGTTDGGGKDGALADSATDAKSDGSPASGDAAVDSPSADASDGSTQPAPLALCTVFDSKFLMDETGVDPVQAQTDRGLGWAGDISQNLINATGGYIGGDCSLSGLPDALSDNMKVDYANQLNDWVQQFFGCPINRGDAGALPAYGLIPPGLAPPAHVYTKGDLDKLSSDLVDAINNTIACAGDCLNPSMLPDGGTLANVAPLTDNQVASIRAEITYLQSQVSPAPVDSRAISFSPSASCDTTTCMTLCPAMDAGASGDASEASASDASGE